MFPSSVFYIKSIGKGVFPGFNAPVRKTLAFLPETVYHIPAENAIAPKNKEYK
jgi:hypothetical protein